MFTIESKLVVNADDYGRSAGISRGVREAHLQGIVSSTTIMANFENAAHEVELARAECPKLRLGAHLNISAGFPLSPTDDIPALVRSDGQFKSPEALLTALDEIPIDQVDREWRRQIESLLTWNVDLDHLDSHHHLAAASRELWSLHLALADEYHIGVRLPYPTDDDDSTLVSNFPDPLRRFASDIAPAKLQQANLPRTQALFTSFFAESATPETLLTLLEEATAYTSSEIMCHPGYVEDDSVQTSYGKFRQKELEILTSERVKSAVEAYELELVGFDDI
ncbi:MAG: ChbG/HpnK family deacetylase [Anaerolineales bacterium]|jgi:predicted glycoside hydrolase/deacetylase ChbG (UPF0249 family)